ncbi:MAG: hypothetical protein SFV22_09615 [Saprospiraceae bacterium]|nr:hypothetical protein [Saprospiraceae bacterium]
MPLPIFVGDLNQILNKKMTKLLSTAITLLVMLQIGHGQGVSFSTEKDWVVNHYQGSCYHDTIIHAVWLYIAPHQELRRYQNDTSFVVVEVTVTNKSPIDIYLHGVDNKLAGYIIKEAYVIDTARLNNEKRDWGTYPRKLEKKPAIEMWDDVLKNPHQYLWAEKHKKALIQIPKNTKKNLFVTIPKREGDYRVEAMVEFNKEFYALDCEGERVPWPIIESNKIELKKKKE